MTISAPSAHLGPRKPSRPILALQCLAILAMVVLARSPLGGVAHAMPDASKPVLAQAGVKTHTVSPGETVRSIAELYRVSSETVLAANAIENPDLLHVGEQLVVPSADGALHTVLPGETLRTIAADYGVDLPDLVATNALSASPDVLEVGTLLIVPGARPAAPPSEASNAQRAAGVTSPSPPQVPAGAPSAAENAPGTYTVREGDTLRSIAEAFKLDILSLIDMNGLADPDLIRPGSKLRIASRDTFEHVVESGETVGDIAWRYSVDAHALLQANSLSDPDRIGVGTVLVVPMGRSPMPPPPPTAPPPSRPIQPSEAPAPAPSRPAQPSEAPAPVSPTTDRVIAARVTGYALGAGAVSTRTASGTTTHWGTVAADTHLYPFGTRVRIEGLGDTVFVVEDTGGAVRGNVFDVWFPDAASARRLGAMTRQVTLLGAGQP
jgi:LysM repeat protein/3D (Asp-Asp-Asp) domain-containing protein